MANGPTTEQTAAVQKRLAKSAALLVLLAMLTGFLVASAMTGQIRADPGSMLAAHVNALAGAAWMVAVGWSLPMTRYSAAGRSRLAWATIGPCFANWLVTAIKAFFFVKGVAVSDSTANNVIFAVLGGSVVFPSLGAAGAWVYGLGGAGGRSDEGQP